MPNRYFGSALYMCIGLVLSSSVPAIAEVAYGNAKQFSYSDGDQVIDFSIAMGLEYENSKSNIDLDTSHWAINSANFSFEGDEVDLSKFSITAGFLLMSTYESSNWMVGIPIQFASEDNQYNSVLYDGSSTPRVQIIGNSPSGERVSHWLKTMIGQSLIMAPRYKFNGTDHWNSQRLDSTNALTATRRVNNSWYDLNSFPSTFPGVIRIPAGKFPIYPFNVHFKVIFKKTDNRKNYYIRAIEPASILTLDSFTQARQISV